MKEYSYKINGEEYKVNIISVEDSVASVEVNGVAYQVEMEKPVKAAPQAIVRPVVAAASQVAHVPAGEVAGAIKSPLPGVILDIAVKVGDAVKAGQKVMVLEAMKMENVINADRDGKVVEIKVAKGDSVLEGVDLMVIG
ncbi:biotin/lipoyl-containing protein [Microbacter margulisiae]|uniref:Biotin carboxyl carrier protein n=1 Tax=Microbacter margulisiae TaxID=1350067 RepID=A0A7W5DQV1_9PORP|nr:biotin/lipoyl-containing protein [Microbacter margulisiae]MBB3187291.1 biotin carboxyl carrier protein [Microbacter margulisiae]